MIQLDGLRSKKNKIASALKKRGLKEIHNDLSKVIELDDRRKKLKSELDKILEESNIISKEIGIKIRNGEKDLVDELKKSMEFVMWAAMLEFMIADQTPEIRNVDA